MTNNLELIELIQCITTFICIALLEVVNCVNFSLHSAAVKSPTSPTASRPSSTVAVQSPGTQSPGPMTISVPASPSLDQHSSASCTPDSKDSPAASCSSSAASGNSSLPPVSPTPGRQVKANHAYAARTGKELSFNKNDIIQVFSKSPDGNWWDSLIDGKRGYIPASYVKV